MHMTMRKYRQLKGTPEAAIVWVKKNLMPILKKSKGFKAYYAVAFDDGTIGSINVFESEEAAYDANKQVRKEIRNSASDMLEHVDTKLWKILYEDHRRRSTDTGA
jgi:hypothetical protein